MSAVRPKKLGMHKETRSTCPYCGLAADAADRVAEHVKRHSRG